MHCFCSCVLKFKSQNPCYQSSEIFLYVNCDKAVSVGFTELDTVPVSVKELCILVPSEVSLMSLPPSPPHHSSVEQCRPTCHDLWANLYNAANIT
jgi:hypothetical protein